MGGKWLPGLIVHQLLCISMVRTDKHNAVHFPDGLHCTAHAGVHCLDGLDGCVLYPGMAYHVRVCKVDDDDIVFAGFDGFHQLIAHAVGTHLRL